MAFVRNFFDLTLYDLVKCWPVVMLRQPTAKTVCLADCLSAVSGRLSVLSTVCLGCLADCLSCRLSVWGVWPTACFADGIFKDNIISLGFAALLWHWNDDECSVLAFVWSLKVALSSRFLSLKGNSYWNYTHLNMFFSMHPNCLHLAVQGLSLTLTQAFITKDDTWCHLFYLCHEAS